jgi:hypothetical protein
VKPKLLLCPCLPVSPSVCKCQKQLPYRPGCDRSMAIVIHDPSVFVRCIRKQKEEGKTRFLVLPIDIRGKVRSLAALFSSSRPLVVLARHVPLATQVTTHTTPALRSTLFCSPTSLSLRPATTSSVLVHSHGSPPIRYHHQITQATRPPLLQVCSFLTRALRSW